MRLKAVLAGIVVAAAAIIAVPAPAQAASLPGYSQLLPRHVYPALNTICLDVIGAGTANNTGVQQWTCNGGNHQQWTFVSAGSGYYTIRPGHVNKCLDVPNASTANGVKLVIWDCHGGNNQRFELSAGTTSGVYAYHLRPVSGFATNQCLDITDVSPYIGALLQQYSCFTPYTNNQLFIPAV